jgi:polysaccharide biosynthesis/export protein
MMTPALRFIVPVSLFVAAATGCRSHAVSAEAQALYADAARHDPRGKPYVIGVADVVRVGVWKDESLSADAIVRPDGTITMPLVGEMLAAGRTAAELQQDATRRLASLVKDASVTVSVVEVNSYRFTVAGNVEHPGLFSARYYLTVSEALALAGGPNRYAETDEVVIVRWVNGKLVRIPINYDDILSGRSPEQDIVILAGDSVRVP